MNRIDRDTYGLTVARAVAARADCTRRQVGAVIMDGEGRIVSTGYNGAPAGEPGCASAGACPRGRLSYDEHPHGVAYESGESRCIAVHAEANAVIYAGRERTKGCTIYVTDEPCYLCALVIKAAGIVRVVTPETAARETEVRTILDVLPITPPHSIQPHPDGSATLYGPEGVTHFDPSGSVRLRLGAVLNAADVEWLTPERKAAYERLQADAATVEGESR